MTQPLVLVSNRGPVSYEDDGSVKRGTGGLVTALTGLASHRDAIWIASAMTDGDIEQSSEHGGRPLEVEAPEGGTYHVRFVASDPEAYDRFYNIFANPMLWTRATRRTSGATRSRRTSRATRSSIATWPAPSWRRSTARASRS
jgi:trehalose-6-phosphate synthase